MLHFPPSHREVRWKIDAKWYFAPKRYHKSVAQISPPLKTSTSPLYKNAIGREDNMGLPLQLSIDISGWKCSAAFLAENKSVKFFRTKKTKLALESHHHIFIFNRCCVTLKVVNFQVVRGNFYATIFSWIAAAAARSSFWADKLSRHKNYNWHFYWGRRQLCCSVLSGSLRHMRRHIYGDYSQSSPQAHTRLFNGSLWKCMASRKIITH